MELQAADSVQIESNNFHVLFDLHKFSMTGERRCPPTLNKAVKLLCGVVLQGTAPTVAAAHSKIIV